MSESTGTRHPTQARMLVVRGARTNSLQNISVSFPLHCLCVVTGVSGSGKSSLAIDTIAVEGQRRYLEAITLGRGRGTSLHPRPAVEAIEHLPPTSLVAQSPRHAGPRATLGTISDLWPLWQALYAQAGLAHCPDCRLPMVRHHRRDIIEFVRQLPERTKLLVLAPLDQAGSELAALLNRISLEGYVRARVNGVVVDSAGASGLPPALESLEAVIDRLIVKDGIPARLEESLEAALTLGQGVCITSAEIDGRWVDRVWSTVLRCEQCRRIWPVPDRETFSWQSPVGACEVCHGTGTVSMADTSPADGLPDGGSQDDRPPDEQSAAPAVEAAGDNASAADSLACPACAGTRLSRLARAVTLAGQDITAFARQSISDLLKTVTGWRREPAAHSAQIFTGSRSTLVAERILPELQRRLHQLEQTGLGYLSLDRAAASLSRGELQRVRLATALGGGSQGLLYVFDEPTSGLHVANMHLLLNRLRELCDSGNSVLVVEHQPEFIAHADWIIDLGPGAGPRGGQVLASEPLPEFIKTSTSPTADMLRERQLRRIRSDLPTADEAPISLVTPLTDSDAAIRADAVMRLTGARRHGLKDVTLELPAGKLCGIAGVSGSGKSTLIFDCLLPALQRALRLRTSPVPADCGQVDVTAGVQTVRVVRGVLPGRSVAASPATLSGIWSEIRRLFARTREARRLGYSAARFSYRHPDSRCPRCRGAGTVTEADVTGARWSRTCPECRGRRFQRGLQSITYKGLSVADVLELRIETAVEFFTAFERIGGRLRLLDALGLGYLSLGQPGDTLSGGELQRLYLGKFLQAAAGIPTLFLLDEPTAGLHVSEIRSLVSTLQRLTGEGHTVVVIEHSLDVLREVDWLIELGPGSGPEGGAIIAAATPAAIATAGRTPTGRVLGTGRMPGSD